MFEVKCKTCGKSGQLPQRPRKPVDCPQCEKRLGSGDPRERILAELRGHLRSYSVPLPLAKRFYRVLIRAEEYREFQIDMLSDRCVELLVERSQLAAKEPAAGTFERWISKGLGEGLIASAAVHRLLSDLAYEQGEDERGVQELTIANMIAGRVLETGEGTQRSPHFVADVQDEYLALRRSGRESLDRLTIEKRGRNFDVHRCSDESRVWFDVTPQFEAYTRLGFSD
jgi:hypothetical protein